MQPFDNWNNMAYRDELEFVIAPSNIFSYSTPGTNNTNATSQVLPFPMNQQLYAIEEEDPQYNAPTNGAFSIGSIPYNQNNSGYFPNSVGKSNLFAEDEGDDMVASFGNLGEIKENVDPLTGMITPLKNQAKARVPTSFTASRSPLQDITPKPKKSPNSCSHTRTLLYSSTKKETNPYGDGCYGIKNFR